jgi:aromatic ring-opening dioxygenase catalytic subunit (LigB family)
MQESAPDIWDPSSGSATYSAIIFISAHWATHGEIRVTSSDCPGFEHSYGNINYCPPGNPQLAARIVALLNESGIAARVDSHAALDDVVVGPLHVMFPPVATGQCKMPVLEMSINRNLDPDTHIALGRALSQLNSSEDVQSGESKPFLFVGSGMSWHNFSFIQNGHTHHVQKKVKAFNKALETVLSGRSGEDATAELRRWKHLLPHADFCHPPDSGNGDHFMPLIVVAAACGSSIASPVNAHMINRDATLPFQNFKWTSP